MLNRKLIVITGPDGTGKSLLTKYLYYVLRKEGVQVCLMYGGWRGFNNVYAQLVKKVYQAILGMNKIHSSSIKSSQVNIFRKRKIKSLFKLIVFLDYYISVIFRITLYLRIYDAVILDRYYIDLIVNMSIDLEENLREMLLTYRVVKPMMPRPKNIFLLVGPPQMLFNRKNDIPSIDFSREQCRNFLYISAYDEEIQKVGALKDIQEKARIVLQKIGIKYESGVSYR